MSFFKNKTAIVTGSSNGVGRTIAMELCKQGAQVVLNGRSAEKLNGTLKEFQQAGFSVIAVVADVTQPSECENLVKQTIEKFGKLDILINNAGLSMSSRFENLQYEVFDRVIRSNIQGSAFPSIAAFPHIKKTKGSIVFISSVAGIMGLPTASAYSAGKMALTALTQSMQIEVPRSEVHVGMIRLGFTKNDDAKRVLNGSGNPIPVATRPGYMQQTQEQVAHSVLRMIRRRTRVKTLSAVGKITLFMARFFPGLTRAMIRSSQKRMRKMYELKKEN